MLILTVVGARPQLIKAAAVSRELRKRHKEILVHTGQHYDENMSAVFFRELGIPEPDHNLGVGSGTHGAQTGAMLSGIEKLLLKTRPDRVLVYGDTNSTLAGALAAAKLHIPVAHVEAGLRSFNRRMPEEINRLLTDHVSDLLLCPSRTAADNLAKEGIRRGVRIVGDVMYDALLAAAERGVKSSHILSTLKLEPKTFLLVTIHRAENTDAPDRLSGILSALRRLSETEQVVFPVHPRTRKKLKAMAGELSSGRIRLIDPVGYLDMVTLERSARLILTDSGGIQKEAYWLKVPCITLRDETEWVETVKAGWNVVVGAKTARIVAAARTLKPPKLSPSFYGEGLASRKIAGLLA